jgi:hypothetical protein
MGGLEGLINILDSEGGFGALEMQVDTSMSYFNIKEYLNFILCSCSMKLILRNLSASSGAGSFLYQSCI